ncbi:DUF2231 domain-containing protein [Nocardia sp. NPDC050175]|uniref:DUF2231 domain-containing protein n=1 Tax=Nocardia sp. NPDC050175 TaxID=3364317 RepID=UPI0037A97271
MGPTVINGLPAHILFVHIVVVLVPLTALLLVLSVLWPAARRRLGVITPMAAFVTLVFVPLTTHAGEWLEHNTARDPLIQIHAHLGDQMLYWSAGVFLLSATWWAIHNEQIRGRLRWPADRPKQTVANKTTAIAVAIVALTVSIGSVVEVYRIGDSGAKAVWHDRATAIGSALDTGSTTAN